MPLVGIVSFPHPHGYLSISGLAINAVICKGFWIEVMTGEYVDLSKESYPELIVSLMEKAFGAFKSFRTDGRIPQLRDPGLRGQTIQTSTTKEEFALFLDTLEESLVWAKAAINALTEGKASEWWRKIFGNRFPLAQDSKTSQNLLSPAAVPSGLHFPNRPVTPRKPGGFA